MNNTISSEIAFSRDALLVINVTRNGKYKVADANMTSLTLASHLAGLVKKNPAQKVLVLADADASHGHVARAVLICKKGGIKEANIGYQILKTK
jgi:biopolymer transport protein ExbD